MVTLKVLNDKFASRYYFYSTQSWIFNIRSYKFFFGGKANYTFKLVDI